jgi:broad specificity phosphatase PhoE
MKLFLIRHAQSQNNSLPESERVEDPGLTELGHQQARHLAERVGELGPTKLFTSPFLRTLETTNWIVEATKLTPHVRVALHEVGGCYTGHTTENIAGRPGMNRVEIEREFPGYVTSADIDDQGWWESRPFENQESAEHRAAGLLQRTVDEFLHTDERVAFVMHADFKLLFLQQFHPEWLDVPCNASVTTIHIENGNCRLQDYNDIRHLPDELVMR